MPDMPEKMVAMNMDMDMDADTDTDTDMPFLAAHVARAYDIDIVMTCSFSFSVHKLNAISANSPGNSFDLSSSEKDRSVPDVRVRAIAHV